MSATEKRKIRVFIASPNDLAEERRVFRDAIKVLNVGFGYGANVEFIPLGWEDTLAFTGRRVQRVINELIDSCDVFILAMHRRWGQDAPDAGIFTSYTEEEFHRALNRWNQSGAPEIFVFFKLVDAESEADPGPQLRKVMDFRLRLEETAQIRYRNFDSKQAFIDEVDRHLMAYAKDELPKADERREIVVLPIAALQDVENEKQFASEKAEEAMLANDVAETARLRMEETQLETAEDAAEYAKEGKVEFAREKFTKLVTETENLRILFLAYEFFNRTGDLDSAIKVLEKWLSLSGAENISADTAAVLGNLALLYQKRGELHRAEEMHWKSLVMEENLGRQKEMVNIFINLGVLYRSRGELDRAERMFWKSLAEEEVFGRPEVMANIYINLGALYQIRGDLDRAQDMYQKSLTVVQILGNKEGVAHIFCNLGLFYKTRGDYAQAENMFRSSLLIYEELGHHEGIANLYSNLGILYEIQGYIDQAEEMHRKSLAIDEALGRKEGMSRDYGNLGNIYFFRREFDSAEVMTRKALAIDTDMGNLEGVASSCGSLGNLYHARGEFKKAEEKFLKALEIDEILGRKEQMAIAYCNLGNLYYDRGFLSRAEKMYEKSIVLFRELGSPKEKYVEDLLNKLRNGESLSEDGVEA